jgi:Zinc finger, C3HC4 type (RING finger)
MSRISASKSSGISISGVQLANGHVVDVKADGIYENGRRIVAHKIPSRNVSTGPNGVFVGGVCIIDGTVPMPSEVREIELSRLVPPLAPGDRVLVARQRLNDGNEVQARASGIYLIGPEQRRIVDFTAGIGNVQVSAEGILIDGRPFRIPSAAEAAVAEQQRRREALRQEQSATNGLLAELARRQREADSSAAAARTNNLSTVDGFVQSFMRLLNGRSPATVDIEALVNGQMQGEIEALFGDDEPAPFSLLSLNWSATEQIEIEDNDDGGVADAHLCDICQTNLRDVALLPCGHAMLCVACAHEIGRPATQARRLAKCPVCKTDVSDACRMKL